jgi:hypothetical protein
VFKFHSNSQIRRKNSIDRCIICLFQVIGDVDLVPILGRSFTMFYPVILIILCLFNILDLYGKILNYLGFNAFGFKDNLSDEKMEEGKKILENMNKSYTMLGKDNSMSGDPENRYNYYNKVKQINLRKQI